MSTPKPRPRALLSAAVQANSIPDLTSALEAARSASPDTYHDFLRWALIHTCRNRKPNLTIHLLTQENAPAEALDPHTVAQAASIPLLALLTNRYGWDINQQSSNDVEMKGQRVLDFSVREPQVVKWLLQHGATIDGAQSESDAETRLVQFPPPVLETCARSGCVESAKLFLKAGAKWSRRSLQQAVESAAMVGADPGNETPDEQDEEAEERVRADTMLRFMVEDQKLDVNELDTEIPRTSWYGTALIYASKEPRGAKVVKWLLEHGADPTIKSAEGYQPLMLAKSCHGCEEVAKILEEWERN
jgi:hypothetical protein